MTDRVDFTDALNVHQLDPHVPPRRDGPPPRLSCADEDIYKFMRRRDAEAFAYTAWWFNVYLLVRRSNVESIRYVGAPGYTPKPADCKAKTAPNSFFHTGLGRHLNVAGLVCDPTLPEFEKAYGAKHQKAVEIWHGFRRDFLHTAHDDDGTLNRMYISGRFFVDMDKSSPHYGVVKQTSSGLVTAADWIHGDYDLYGIVPADRPWLNIALSEEHPVSPRNRVGLSPAPDGTPSVPNCRGQKFTDVQIMLNRMMNTPMILHGSQEKYSTDANDRLDVFLPCGEVSVALKGEREIDDFYLNELQGRKRFSANPNDVNYGKPLFGKWRYLV